MSPRLRNMLAVLGVATISGVTYLVARPDRDATRPGLLDAGFADCAPRTLECEVRVLPTCEGYTGRRMRTVRMPGRECEPGPDSDGGLSVLVVAPGHRLRECTELRGSVEEACEVVTDGGTADDDDDARPQPVGDRCFCRARDGGLCRYAGPDGGPVVMAYGTVRPGPVVGVACRRSACGIFFGDTDEAALHEDCL